MHSVCRRPVALRLRASSQHPALFIMQPPPNQRNSMPSTTHNSLGSSSCPRAADAGPLIGRCGHMRLAPRRKAVDNGEPMYTALRRRDWHGVQTRLRLRIHVRHPIDSSRLASFRLASLVSRSVNCIRNRSPREPDVQVVKRLIALPGTARRQHTRGIRIRRTRTRDMRDTSYGTRVGFEPDAQALAHWLGGQWMVPHLLIFSVHVAARRGPGLEARSAWRRRRRRLGRSTRGPGNTPGMPLVRSHSS
jgi:hypothetical protein